MRRGAVTQYMARAIKRSHLQSKTYPAYFSGSDDHQSLKSCRFRNCQNTEVQMLTISCTQYPFSSPSRISYVPRRMIFLNAVACLVGSPNTVSIKQCCRSILHECGLSMACPNQLLIRLLRSLSLRTYESPVDVPALASRINCNGS